MPRCWQLQTGSDADREADKRRDPLPFLAFADVRPGMKVLDMGAGRGYSTELIARAVAPSGMVYGQNPPDLPEKPKAHREIPGMGRAKRYIITIADDDRGPLDKI
jgi:predicted methyltransferase